MGKVKKVIPISALCFYGPLSKPVDLAHYGPFWSLFFHFFGPIRVWMALNLAQWGRVLPYCTGGGLWGSLGAILGHFRPFRSDFRAQSKMLGPVLEPISHLFGYPKWLGWLQIWNSGAGYYHTVLVGAFGGHFGSFWSDFGPQIKRLGPIWSLFLTGLAT